MKLKQFMDVWKTTPKGDYITCPVCGGRYRRGQGLRLHLYRSALYPVFKIVRKLDINKKARKLEHSKLIELIQEYEKS